MVLERPRAQGRATTPQGEPERRGIKALLHGMVASQAELEAVEEQKETRRQGCASVGALEDRRRAVVSGVIRSVTLRPRTTVPALEAELYDGSGSLTLVWLGRRSIAGIDPGRRLRAEGLVCAQSGRRTMYNPRYELAPRPGESPGE